jgi:EAL domain-containing protein (putative c-di-GMP-specific phosphodiesterase class I)
MPFELTGRRPAVTSDRLAKALERGDIRAEYQPKVSLVTGDLIGIEALARWTDADLGAVSPEEFIPIAEQSGLIGELTLVVLRSSLATCAQLRRSYPTATVAVNISPVLLGDSRLPDEVAQALEHARVVPNALVAEVTESAVVAEHGNETLRRLRATGISCAIDDFGTGYASLLSLLKMPFTELKIDRAFTAACRHSPDAWKIVAATVRLARDLNLRVVAEGIESEAIAQRLREVGCEYGQGFRYGKAMPRADLMAIAEASRSRSAIVDRASPSILLPSKFTPPAARSPIQDAC